MGQEATVTGWKSLDIPKLSDWRYIQPTMGSRPRCQTLDALVHVTRVHPHERKRLVVPDVNYGRELLVTLARETGGWIGWEATNLRGIAGALAFVALAERELRVATDVDVAAFVNRALHQTIERGQVSARCADLARSLGFRRAVRDALLELRVAGVSSDALRNGAPSGAPARDLVPILDAYERLLVDARLADPAAVFRAALDTFDHEAAFVLDGVTLLAPSLSRRGLPGMLVARLLAYGARVLDADAGTEVPVPPQLLARTGETTQRPTASRSLLARVATPALATQGDRPFDPTCVQVDLFAAATPSDEIREIHRRVLAEGWRWDDVEIVATDPDTYGIALDALCQQLGVGATMLHGVPLTRTRLGRALERWLGWLDDGLPADTLRQALEAGELTVPDTTGASATSAAVTPPTVAPASVAPATLARELRALRIGWGRARYETTLARLDDGRRLAELRRYEDESHDAFAARRASRERTIAALAALLRTILAATPDVPERGSERHVPCSCTSLARATLAYLQLVPVHGQSELHTMERLRKRLTELTAVDDPETSFAGARATLRDALADLRAWPLVTSDRKPWRSAGGMPHLTDVASAGATGRRRIFVVGLDAERTGGGGRQDPLLPDGVRHAIAPEHLATTATHRDERAYTLAAALATLRGRVTLSYATRGTLDGRDAGPAPLLLQTWRLLRGDPSLSYDALREALMPPVSSIPAPAHPASSTTGPGLLDARDVWLDALADGPLLLDGTAAVREAFPMLAAGLAAHALTHGDHPTAHHGLVPTAGPTLDPSARPDREISPSSLETLAACPLAWFYRYGLSLASPSDPEYDAERWLDPLQRGELLHAVYETFTREYQHRQDTIADASARARILEIADERLRTWRERIPPPSETVLAMETEEIRSAALAFLRMECDHRSRGDDGRWLRFETGFGFGTPPGVYAVDDGRTLSVRGRVDRLDELPDGTLRVVDYKTGTATPYAKHPRNGPFDGGRQLQPALYAAAIETVSGRPVSRFEYRFPTERGSNETVVYTTAELAAARTTIGSLLDHVRAGEFVPTTDADDCKFCEYGAICRAGRDDFGNPYSPRAAWAKTHAAELSIYAPMLARRTRDEGSA